MAFLRVPKEKTRHFITTSNVNSDKDDIFAGIWAPFFADMAKPTEAIEALTGEKRKEQEAGANRKIKSMVEELWTVFVKAKESEA